MLVLPPSLTEYAMRCPSGDHVGWSSQAPKFVRARCPVPSAFIIQISALEPRTRVNAMLCPSGDQAGAEFNPRPAVRLRSLSPSPFIIQTSLFPGEGARVN